ncbi:MAG: hypothetical protein ACLPSW_25560 [Roseiarcus sp.]
MHTGEGILAAGLFDKEMAASDRIVYLRHLGVELLDVQHGWLPARWLTPKPGFVSRWPLIARSTATPIRLDLSRCPTRRLGARAAPQPPWAGKSFYLSKRTFNSSMALLGALAATTGAA